MLDLNYYSNTRNFGIVSGLSTKPEVHEPNQNIWEKKDLVEKMELLAHISDVQGEAVKKLQTSH